MPHILQGRQGRAVDGMLNGNDQHSVPAALNLAEVHGPIACDFNESAWREFAIGSF